jgi:hypothetical protein
MANLSVSVIFSDGAGFAPISCGAGFAEHQAKTSDVLLASRP